MTDGKKMYSYIWKLTERDVATILAALRHWQRHLETDEPAPDELDIATDMGSYTELGIAEVDSLCDALNEAEGEK